MPIIPVHQIISVHQMIGEFLNPSVSWLKICGDFWLRLSGYGRVLVAVTYSKGFRWVSEPPATTWTCQLFDKSSGSGWGAADHLISLCCSGSSAGLSLDVGLPQDQSAKGTGQCPTTKVMLLMVYPGAQKHLRPHTLQL